MLQFSEYVSLGHPDKTADYISQYLLDRYITHDPDTRYAVEVQIKGEDVTLGGEVSSRCRFTEEEVDSFVRCAVCEIGYTRDYKERWGADNTICGEDLRVHQHITQQSRDIAQGLSHGWGDQGIFFGYCTPDLATAGMPQDHTEAKRLCRLLYESGLGGLDIKTQVGISSGAIKKVIVAVPLLPSQRVEDIESFVRAHLKGQYELIVNGTGRYVAHSSVADCGTTGRKLAVDFYGGKCRIGGGSPWTKDASKADLTLNLVARHMARNLSAKTGDTVSTCLACCIGRPNVDYVATSGRGLLIESGSFDFDPAEIRHQYRLDTPIYASMCRWGLFGEFQRDKEWEK